MTLEIYTDGGARGNPGPAATGFVIYYQKHLLYSGGQFLGTTTNNVAEYQAVYDALHWLTSPNHLPPLLLPPPPLHFHLDSSLVVNQLKGKFKVKQPHLAILKQQINSLITTHSLTCQFSHVYREANTIADAIVNRILDQNLT